MNKLHAIEQNYKVACALSAVEDAVKKLSESGVAVHAISIDNNLPYLMTSNALACPDISPISRARHGDSVVIYRACLFGCVLQFEVNETEEEQAA